jgi:cytochrome c-type biogenesis protein CcmH
MRRAVLVCALLALALAAAAGASEQKPTLAELERELICPTCQTTLELSNAPIAERMRAFIRARIAAGDTKSEIKAALVEQFGERVLAAPPKKGFNLLAWVLPLAGAALALGLLAFALVRWSRARPDTTAPVPTSANGGPPLDPELERRLDEELARYDG